MLVPSLSLLRRRPTVYLLLSTSLHSRTYCSSPLPPISCSPARLRKLIASHPDPLVSKEILDLTSSQDPSFLSSPKSYPPIHALILRLARSRHHSLADSLLRRLPSPSPGLYSSLLRLHSLSGSPDLALSTFRQLTVRHPSAARPRHLNRLLSALASHPQHFTAAVSLFNSSLRGSICGGAVKPNACSLNILMTVACRLNKLSVAYSLFNSMFDKGTESPNVESYRILMQGLCRKSQVNSALGLLEDMLNKGYTPDALSYTTLLNNLCRKKKLREAYKTLCRMKVKGCNPDIVHYNTIILGFCREGRAVDACKVLDEMPDNGCLPNLVSYSTLVNGLCSDGLLEEANVYLEQMMERGLLPHFSVFHCLIKGFCNVGNVDKASHILCEMLKMGVVPHLDTWLLIIHRICDEDGERLATVFEIIKMTKDTRRKSRGFIATSYVFERDSIRR